MDKACSSYFTEADPYSLKTDLPARDRNEEPKKNGEGIVRSFACSLLQKQHLLSKEGVCSFVRCCNSSIISLTEMPSICLERISLTSRARVKQWREGLRVNIVAKPTSVSFFPQLFSANCGFVVFGRPLGAGFSGVRFLRPIIFHPKLHALQRH